MKPSGLWCSCILFPSSVTGRDVGDWDMYFPDNWWQTPSWANTIAPCPVSNFLHSSFFFPPLWDNSEALQYSGCEAEMDPVVFRRVGRLCWRVGLAVYEDGSICKGFPDQVSAKFLKAADSDVANDMFEISRGSTLLLWMISNARKASVTSSSHCLSGLFLQ